MKDGKISNFKTGRRKTSIAQVKISQGKGEISINSKKVEDFFKGCERFQHTALSAIKNIKDSSKYSYKIKVSGGGPGGQAGAVLHATARVLAQMSDENKKTLRKKGFLTRDPRMVERKKPGRPKARRKFQYSKR
jgi:small subunit ribosomal protein S9